MAGCFSLPDTGVRSNGTGWWPLVFEMKAGKACADSSGEEGMPDLELKAWRGCSLLNMELAIEKESCCKVMTAIELATVSRSASSRFFHKVMKNTRKHAKEVSEDRSPRVMADERRTLKGGKGGQCGSKRSAQASTGGCTSDECDARIESVPSAHDVRRATDRDRRSSERVLR